MPKIITPAIFAESFRRAWLGARGTLRYDRRDQNDLIQLPHRIGMIYHQLLGRFVHYKTHYANTFRSGCEWRC